jgi:hypothetical protein
MHDALVTNREDATAIVDDDVPRVDARSEVER